MCFETLWLIYLWPPHVHYMLMDKLEAAGGVLFWKCNGFSPLYLTSRQLSMLGTTNDSVHMFSAERLPSASCCEPRPIRVDERSHQKRRSAVQTSPRSDCPRRSPKDEVVLQRRPDVRFSHQGQEGITNHSGHLLIYSQLYICPVHYIIDANYQLPVSRVSCAFLSSFCHIGDIHSHCRS